MHITVLYSMPTRRALASPYSDTEQDTVESAHEVERALTQKGAVVTLLPIDEDTVGRISDVKTDLIFNLIDWTGLDLPLSDRAFALIEATGVPFTGATRANYIETSDKMTMKAALVSRRLPTARFQIFARGDEEVRPDFRYPVIIKPALEHCSIGLTHEAVVHDAGTLSRKVLDRVQKFMEPMIAEEFIEGREFQVTGVEDASGLLVLPPAEIIFDDPKGNAMLTYESRWDDQSADYKSSHVALAALTPVLQSALTTVTKRTFTALGYRDYIRIRTAVTGQWFPRSVRPKTGSYFWTVRVHKKNHMHGQTSVPAGWITI